MIGQWPLRQDEILKGPIQFKVGENVGSKLLEPEMPKIMPGTLLSLNVDKWGATTCYDDMSGDVLKSELV